MTVVLWVLTRAALLGAVWFFDEDDGTTELAYTWAREVLAGTSPYHEAGVAYPPLAMFGHALPGIVSPSPGAYALAFALTMLAVDAAGARLGGRRYILAVAAMGPVLLLWRYDLAPAVCHLAAAAAALRGRRDASWAWLGASIALKPYLAVAVPLWLLWDPRARGLALTIAPSLAAALLMLPIAGADVLDPYLFQAQRGLSVESGPAFVTMLLSAGQNAYDEACLCWVREGVPLAGTLGTLAGLTGIAFLTWRFARGERTAMRLVRASVAMVAVTLLTAPVFGPQYLIWLVPPAVLLGRRETVLAGLAALTGALAYPILYDEVLAVSVTGLALLTVRAAFLTPLAGTSRTRRASRRTPHPSSTLP